jgi:phosphoglycerate dehydrogenase-like enzyme
MRVLFAAPEDAWSGFLERLRQTNPEHEFVAAGAFAIDSLRGFDVVIPTMTRVTRSALESADRLKLVQQVGAGVEGIDIQAAGELGVKVANVPSQDSGNADSVAELGVYLMIALARDAPAMARNMREGRIGAPFGMALKGRTAGIIGLGGLGAALAARLRAFGMRLHGIKRHDPARARTELGLDWAGGPEQLPQLLGASDFVILCLPDNPSSHGLMNRTTFGYMKRGAYLVNLGRGGLVEREALLAALESGTIAGAGLDVFWQEPPDPDDPIFSRNIIATPHVAGSTDLSVQGILAGVSDNLARLARGEPIRNVIHG